MWGLLLAFFDLLLTYPGKIMAMLGIGWLSYQGYSAVVGNIVNLVITNVNSMPAVIFNLAAMAGFVNAFGVILAAIVARGSLTLADKLTKIL